MPELKIKCQHPESLKKIIENMIFDRAKSLKEGIAETKTINIAQLTMAEEGTAPQMDRVPKLGDLSKDHIGKTVKLHGWVYSVRVGGAGSICFVDLGDGTTVTPTRCIAQKPGGDEPAEHPYLSDK